MKKYSMRKAVDNGEVYLDLTFPGWYLKCDPDNLVMESCRRCVIGQLAGNFCDYLNDACIDRTEEDWGTERGFDLYVEGPLNTELFWRALRSMWIARILARRNEHDARAMAEIPDTAWCT